LSSTEAFRTAADLFTGPNGMKIALKPCVF
jgi:hypothetical protein